MAVWESTKGNQEVVVLLQDLIPAGVFHFYHARPEQFVKAPPDSPLCPRHGHAHEWRVIDFDRCQALSASLADVERAMNSTAVVESKGAHFYNGGG
ncbi:hypothetical protein K474DRAFT_1712986 [Panus rudis PR-1116 ss-1]|nr:hypothetical protein K474DRAFT_1712986 [Panus rudis PR-1116 ss-1]